MRLLSSTDREAFSSFLQIPNQNSTLMYGWSHIVFSRLKIFQNWVPVCWQRILKKNSTFFFFFQIRVHLLGHQFSQFSSVHFSHSVVSDSLRPHESQHTRPPCPSQLSEFTQTHVHLVSDAIQSSHPLSSPSPPARNSSQLQSLFQWVNSSHEVAKVLEFQL